MTIPDVQSSADTRQLAIDKVGIKAIRHPVAGLRARAAACSTPSPRSTCTCGLPHHFKGTHMSRFVEILNAHEREISVETFEAMLREMVERLEAEDRPHRDELPLLHQQGGAGLRRARA